MIKVTQYINTQYSHIGAKIAIQNQLYVPIAGYQLKPLLDNIMSGDDSASVFIASIDSIPVGVAVYNWGADEEVEPNIMVFVGKPFRRIGVAHKLISTLKQCIGSGAYEAINGPPSLHKAYTKLFERHDITLI